MDEIMDAEETIQAITPPDKYAFVPITDFIAEHWLVFVIGTVISIIAAMVLAKKLRGSDGSLDPVSKSVVSLVAVSTLLMFGLSHLFGGYKDNIEDTPEYQARYQQFASNLYEYGMSNGGYLIDPDDAQNFVDGYTVEAISISEYFVVKIHLDKETGAAEAVGPRPAVPLHSGDSEEEHNH